MGGGNKETHNCKVLRISQLYIEESVLIRGFSREKSKDLADTDGNRF